MSLLRPRAGEQDGRVTNSELFFDLVFIQLCRPIALGRRCP